MALNKSKATGLLMKALEASDRMQAIHQKDLDKAKERIEARRKRMEAFTVNPAKKDAFKKAMKNTQGKMSVDTKKKQVLRGTGSRISINNIKLVKAMTNVKEVEQPEAKCDRKTQWEKNRDWKMELKEREDELDSQLSNLQTRVAKSVVGGLSDEERVELKSKLIDLGDQSLIKNYKSQQVIKDMATGQLKNISNFALDLDNPHRAFRAFKAK